MSYKALIVVVGLVAFGNACSNDEENTDETVGLSGEAGDMGAGMDQGMPSDLQPVKPTQASLPAPPPMPTPPNGAAAAAAAAAKAVDQAKAAEPPKPTSTTTPTQVATNGSGLAQPGAGQQSFYVRSAVLRVRSGPGKEHPTVGYVVYNMQVTEIPGGTSTWAKIGQNKFVARSCLSHDMNSKQFIPGS